MANCSIWGEDVIGTTSVAYGVPSAGPTAALSGLPTATWNDEIGFAVTEYGVQHGQRDVGVEDVPSPGIFTVQQRDDWWKWALGAGIVSVGAYAIYQHVTGRKS